MKMIDYVKICITKELLQNTGFKYFTTKKQKDKKIIKNIDVIRYVDSDLWIYGSLSKFYFGNNVERLDIEQTKKALNKLSKELNFDLSIKGVYLNTLEFGFNFIMEKPIYQYLSLLFSYPKKNRNTTYSKTKKSILETVYFGSKSGMEKIIFYDKGSEAKKEIETIDSLELFRNQNVLRYENRIQNLEGIEHYFDTKNLNPYDLTKIEVWQKMKDILIDVFNQIEFTDRVCFYDKTNYDESDFALNFLYQKSPETYFQFIENCNSETRKKKLQKIKTLSLKYTSRNELETELSEKITQIKVF